MVNFDEILKQLLDSSKLKSSESNDSVDVMVQELFRISSEISVKALKLYHQQLQNSSND